MILGILRPLVTFAESGTKKMCFLSREPGAIQSQLSRAVYAGAAAITVISTGFKRNLVGKGVPEKKIHVIPNWADEEIYRFMRYDNGLAARHGLAGRLNVVYGGNLGASQALGNVLNADRSA